MPLSIETHKNIQDRKAQSKMVYIAAPFTNRAQARQLKDLVEAAGHVVTSTWIMSHIEDFADLEVEVAANEAAHDLIGVKRADILVFLNGESTSGGMHVEFGFALAHGKTVIIVGKPTSIFHHLPGIWVVTSFSDVIDRISRSQSPRPAPSAPAA